MTQNKHRHALPQLNGQPMLCDGGLETTLIFHEQTDLPLFAAFDLLSRVDGEQQIKAYFERYLQLARRHQRGFILDTPTWRANPDWGAQLRYSLEALADSNQRAIDLVTRMRDQYDQPGTPVVTNGIVGPRGDGYVAGEKMTARQAQQYHDWQIQIFAKGGLDMVSAMTVTYVEEGIGIARAAQSCGIPSVISFTVETDGRLPSGQTLGEAITQVDQQTDSAPAYFMVNCAHPDHFDHVLDRDAIWLNRIRGVRANASRQSHAELDACVELDDGNPTELAGNYLMLSKAIPNLTVFGGCCGTDHRHIDAIADTLATV